MRGLLFGLTFPSICSPLQGQINIELYPQLLDLELADVSSDEHTSDTKNDQLSVDGTKLDGELNWAQKSHTKVWGANAA